MSAPLAYHITWTTYGTWLPGDQRGWVEEDTPGIRPPDADRLEEARKLMVAPAVRLSEAQRALVKETIEAHCLVRGWELHAVNVRTNHVHLVVTADAHPDDVMNQLKAWCSRRLNEAAGGGARRWWTKHGSTKWINDEAYLAEAIDYDTNRQ